MVCCPIHFQGPDSSLDYLGPIVLLELEGNLGSVRVWGYIEAVLREGGNSPEVFSHLQRSFLGGLGRMRCKNLTFLRPSNVRPPHLNNLPSGSILTSKLFAIIFRIDLLNIRWRLSSGRKFALCQQLVSSLSWWPDIFDHLIYPVVSHHRKRSITCLHTTHYL